VTQINVTDFPRGSTDPYECAVWRSDYHRDAKRYQFDATLGSQNSRLYGSLIDTTELKAK